MKNNLRRIFSFLIAALFALSIPLGAMAIEVDTSYGDVSIDDTHVEHYVVGDAGIVQSRDEHEGVVTITHGLGDQDGTVNVRMETGTLEIEGDFSGTVEALGDSNITITGDVTAADENQAVLAAGNSQVNIHGDINTDGHGVYAEGNSRVTMEGDIVAGGEGVYVTEGATVYVEGDIDALNGVNANDDSKVEITGEIEAVFDGIHIDDNAQVTVQGNITAGEDGIDGCGSEIHVTGDIKGMWGIYIYGDTRVEVTGDIEAEIAGIYVEDNAQVTMQGNITSDGDGIEGYGNGVVNVTGDIKGNLGIYVDENAQVEVTGNVEAEEDGVLASGNGQVTVNGTITAETPVAGEDANVTINTPPAPPEDNEKPGEDTEKPGEDTEKPGEDTEKPGEDTDKPSEALEAPAAATFTVTDLNGKSLQWSQERQDDILVITVEGKEVCVTLSHNQLNNLKAQGINTVRVITDECTTDLDVAQLIEKGGKAFTLTHKGAESELTLDGEIVE